MFNKQVFKRCVVTVAAASVAVDVKEKNPSNRSEENLCRPSELPLYSPEPVNQISNNIEEVDQPSKIEEAITATRLKLVEFNKEVTAYRRVGAEQFEKRKDDLDWLLNYLRQEDNTLPKIGAIGIGALTGLIFGLRGGFFKKTLYATTGALGMTAVCYPKEATEYSQVGIGEAKKYLVVGYNFVNGEEKSEITDSEQKVIDNPKDRSFNIEDPLQIITRTRDEALNKECHCPIGACLGHYDEKSQVSPMSTPTQ